MITHHCICGKDSEKQHFRRENRKCKCCFILFSWVFSATFPLLTFCPFEHLKIDDTVYFSIWVPIPFCILSASSIISAPEKYLLLTMKRITFHLQQQSRGIWLVLQELRSTSVCILSLLWFWGHKSGFAVTSLGAVLSFSGEDKSSCEL